MDGMGGLAMRIITVRLHIYAHQESHLTCRAAIKKAVEDLKLYNSQMEGAWIVERLLNLFYIKFDGIDEFHNQQQS